MTVTGTRTTPSNFALRQARRRRAGAIIPGDVQLEMTNRCNLRCFHCYLAPHEHEALPGELSTAEVNVVLDQLFEAGVLSITLTGGEPLCRPDIFQIIEHTRERGLFFGLKTNGTLITGPVADRLKGLGITGVHISLYGATPATHESVTGIPGSYNRTVQAIRLLRERKIRVAIKTTLMKCNLSERKEMETLAVQLGALYSPDPLVFPRIEQPGSADGIRLDDEQLRSLVDECNWVCDDDTTTGDLKRHLICGAGRTRCTISPRGEVFPCSVWRVPLGNLKQKSFRDIWHGETAAKLRTTNVSDFQVCAHCELVGYCARCPGLIHMENSGISGPSSENCRLARAVKGVINDRKQESLREPEHRV